MLQVATVDDLDGSLEIAEIVLRTRLHPRGSTSGSVIQRFVLEHNFLNAVREQCVMQGQIVDGSNVRTRS